ncbi:hypothetical protein AURDEDRAFT_184815 [Auricularia subglabra TFB-10046 SS5]|nr:hypothetical protein AURDEDRAFT_184815 [Auricularia subglabra TFB-10046 SS5]
MKWHRTVLGRPSHIPVEIVQHNGEEGAERDGDQYGDSRIRDSTYFDFQCDLCGRWIKKAQWESHLSIPCNRPRPAKGWIYLDDDSEARPSDPTSTLNLHPAPASPAPSSAPTAPSASSSSGPPTLRIRLPLASKLPRSLVSFLDTPEDEEEVDYADVYSRYVIPGPAPKYAFRHAATPASAKRLRPAVFPDSDADDDEDEGAAQRARDVAKFDVDVLMEGTTRLFLRPRGKSKCRSDAPADANAEQAPPFPETVGMSLRQLMEAGLQPLTF